MKNIIKVLFICIVIFSLGLNVLLLYDKINSKGVVEEKENINNDEKSKTIEYDKHTLGRLFRNYQLTESLADSDKTVIFDVLKITYVGYFKSDKNKKLYYIDEKFNCMDGNDCVNTVGEVTIDKDHNSNTTFVVAVTPIDKYNAEFEILDYSIEETSDFQKENHIELK